MQKASIWSNPDGLVVGFGPRNVENATGTKVVVGGKRQQVIVDISGTTMPLTTDVTRQLPNAVHIPAGAYVESAFLVVKTPFTGGTSLQVGAWNGLTDALVATTSFVGTTLTAALVADAEIVGAGALVGTVLANPVKVIATSTTNLFTAGQAIVVIEYIL